MYIYNMYILNYKKILYFLVFYILNIYFINASNNNLKFRKNKIMNLIHNIETINNIKKYKYIYKFDKKYVTKHNKIIKNNKYIKVNIKKKKKYNINIFSLEQMEKILKEAKSYLGTPYRLGGTSRNGIDCSSLISKIFKIYNIYLPRVSYKQAQKGTAISMDKLQKGDLLFFSTKRVRREKINHVGITIDKRGNNIYFIHASSSNGVIISQIKEPYWKMRFMIAKRIFSLKEIII